MLDGKRDYNDSEDEWKTRPTCQEMPLNSIISNSNVIHIFMALIPQCGVNERRWILKSFKMLLCDGAYDIEYANGETEKNVDHYLIHPLRDKGDRKESRGAMSSFRLFKGQTVLSGFG